MLQTALCVVELHTGLPLLCEAASVAAATTAAPADAAASVAHSRRSPVQRNDLYYLGCGWQGSVYKLCRPLLAVMHECCVRRHKGVSTDGAGVALYQYTSYVLPRPESDLEIGRCL
jgi:hypothetical protein